MAIWYCSSVGYTAVTAWAASTAYSIGDIRRPTAAAANSERVFRCTTAGTSGGSEPTWVNTKAATTTDNTVTWTEITGNSTYNTTTNFAAPHARITALGSWMAAGDFGYLANNHGETIANNIVFVAPGTAAAPNILLSIDPATGLEANGASVATTGTTSQIFMQGDFYAKGITINSGENSPGATGIHLARSAGARQVYENCDFILSNASATASIMLGLSNDSNVGSVDMINCRFKFGATGATVRVIGNLKIRGGGIISGSAAITNFLTWSGPASSRQSTILDVEGFDFTGLATALNLTTGSTGDQNGKVTFSNCKMPASWSGLLTASTLDYAGASVDAWNIAATDINYVFWHERFEGSVKQDTATYMTGGSTDGTTAFSIKMASSADAEFPAHVLYTPDMVVRNETTGSAKTATVEITHSAAADLTDAEIWLEVMYLGTSGFPLSTLVTDRVATILGTPVDQTTSTQAWTNAGTRKQKLAVTFTPQEKGDFIWRVALAKASTTVYVNANLVIT